MMWRKRRREDKMYQIGVDIGGTNIKVGLVNETMELVQTCSVRFPHDGARSVVKTIEEAVDFCCGSRRLRGRT